MKYNNKNLKQFTGKSVMLSYYWNGAKNIITAVINKAHYVVEFRKLDSQTVIRIRYRQVDNIELLKDADRIKD